MNNNDLEIRRKRLVFQSNHRGCKEMDMMMGQFAERYAADMPEDEMTIYEALLEEDDWDIYAWLNNRGEPSDKAYVPLLNKMRDYQPLIKQQAGE